MNIHTKMLLTGSGMISRCACLSLVKVGNNRGNTRLLHLLYPSGRLLRPSITRTINHKTRTTTLVDCLARLYSRAARMSS